MGHKKISMGHRRSTWDMGRSAWDIGTQASEPGTQQPPSPPSSLLSTPLQGELSPSLLPHAEINWKDPPFPYTLYRDCG
eukprot:3069591-Rhodomonas_salina.1